MMPSIAGEQPQLCRSAGGNSSNRSLRSKGRHSDGNATAPPDSAAVPVVFLSCYVFATDTRLCGCAGPSYPSHSTSQLPQSHGSELHDANETRPCSFTLAPVAYWYEPAVCAKNIHQTLRIRTVTARPDAHSRLERRAASAGRFVRTTQPTSCMFVVLYTGDACAQPAATGMRLESRCRRHVCAVPPRSCDSDHDCSPEWPPRASVWHETRTRAAGMHAEYVWPCYVAQLPLCPRVSARLGVPPASCSADSQEISLLG